MGGSRSEAETLALMARIWSQIAFHAMPDETWRKSFRPTDIPMTDWILHEAENIAEDVFRQLEFKGQSTSTPTILTNQTTKKGKNK